MKPFVRNRHTTDAGTDSQVSPQADTDQTHATDRRWEIQRSRGREFDSVLTLGYKTPRGSSFVSFINAFLILCW